MITLGWPAGLALAAGAALPVVLHLLHRTRWQPVRWPAMRLLADVATRRGARLAVEDLLLLALRVLLLLAVALTVARPRWVEPQAADHRRGRVAAALLVDDGLPSGIHERGGALLARQQGLAAAYLASLVAGDEVSVVAGSQADAPLADPLLDLDAARRQVQALTPQATAPDLPALLAAGLARLDRHRNEDAELVVVASGCTAGSALDDDARWADVGERLARNRRSGWRRPRIVLLAPRVEAVTDWAVAALTVDQPLPLPQVPVGIRAVVRRDGRGALPVGLALRLAVDGRTVAESPVPPFVADADGGDQLVVGFTHTFTTPGGHVIEARLIGARDPLPADDQRCASIEAAVGVPVLLVEREPGELDLVAAALDPSDGGDQLAPFAPRRLAAGALGAADLRGVRAAVLGDVGVLEPAATAALERLLAAGGGVLVGCGPHTDAELAARQWFRGGDGLLAAVPGALRERPRHPRPAPGDPPGLAGGTGRAPRAGGTGDGAATADAWRAATVRSAFDVLPGAWQAWAELDDGTPLVVAAHRGQGIAALCTTSLDATWSDLPYRALWVPLVRGVVGGLAATVLPPRNLRPGDALAWPCPGGAANPARAQLSAPDGASVALRPGGWDGAPALAAGPLRQPGAWLLRPVDPADGPPVPYAVGIAAGALDLAPVPVERLRARLAATGCQVDVARTPAEVRRLTDAADDSGIAELTPWCAALALLLLLGELALARRLARGGR